jgi:hypothetical protein
LQQGIVKLKKNHNFIQSFNVNIGLNYDLMAKFDLTDCLFRPITIKDTNRFVYSAAIKSDPDFNWNNYILYLAPSYFRDFYMRVIVHHGWLTQDSEL